jgi:hypothetical protein
VKGETPQEKKELGLSWKRLILGAVPKNFYRVETLLSAFLCEESRRRDSQIKGVDRFP